MSSSTIAIDSAWAVLKQEQGMDSLMGFMEPEDERAAAQFVASLPPEEQQLLQGISESFKHMPPEAQGQLRADAHRLMQEHRGNLSQLLGSSPQEGEGPVNKVLPIVIGAVFALDALNVSQGAKRSLVGNVFTDIGNGLAEVGGAEPNFFGESNYGDMIEYDDEVGYVDPITGQRHAVIEDPSLWDRVKTGVVSTAASFVNPFGVVRGAGRGIGRGLSRAREGATRLAGKGQKAIGAGMQRLAGITGRSRAERLVGGKGPVPNRVLDWAGRKTAQGGARRAAGAATAREAREKAYQEFAEKTGGTGVYGKVNRMTGAGGRLPYRTITGFTHSPGVRDKVSDAAGWLMGAYGLSKLPDGSVDTSGGYGGQGAFRADAAVGGPTGGFAQGYGMQDVSNVTGNRMGEDAIWTDTAAQFQGQHGRGSMAQRSVANQGAFGGFGKGDYMKIGERMLKEAEENMYKKEEGKKPAHGMVIVIGSKAGPGPSTDGKRDKLDSEKDDKEE